jgi:hypothetical protein
LSSFDNQRREHGLQYTYQDGFNSTGFRIVRGLRLQIWIDRRQEMRGNVRELTLLAKNL